MRLPSLNWFRRARSAPIADLLDSDQADIAFDASPLPERPATGTASAPRPEILWSAAHASLLDDLFGDGYAMPGGTSEVLMLARPIGLAKGQTLLMVGAQTGGPVLALTSEFGVWVAGFEAVAAFVRVAGERIKRAKLGPRATIEAWSASAPDLRPKFFHHALALMPLDGAPADQVLSALGGAIKPGGHLVMLEIVADDTFDAHEKTMKSWLTSERRPASLPSEATVTAIMGRLGFDVRVVEDITQRHLHLAVTQWQHLLQTIEGRPVPAVAAVLVAEAERWLLRFELMRAGRLRLVRWHAILGATPAR